MIRYLLPFLLLLPPSWPDVLEKVSRSVVPIQVQDEYATFHTICSAVVIGDQKLLSEGHCFDDSRPRFADGIPVEVVASESELVLLASLGRQREWRAIEVRRTPLRRGEPVATVGFGFGGARPIVTLGVVSTTYDQQMAWTERIPWEADFFDVEAIRGESGGAIVDRRGRLITLVRSIWPDHPNSLTLGASQPVVLALLDN